MADYYEPNAAPEDIAKNERRKVIVRFMTEQDVKQFTDKTGISLMYDKKNKILFPQTNLNNFFN